jgi:hypothetical protein
MIESRIIRWLGCVRNAHKIVVRKKERDQSKDRHTWEGNIKMNFMGI